MDWNDIVQLICSYTYIPLCLLNAFCFAQHTKWNYSVRSVTDSMAGVSSHTALVSCLHRNVKFHRINTRDMLHPRLERSRRREHRTFPPARVSAGAARKGEISLSSKGSKRPVFFSPARAGRGLFLLLICKQGHWVFPFRRRVTVAVT